MPTLTPFLLEVLLGVGGLGGAVYGIVVATRIWKMPLDLADRSFYVFLPILSLSESLAGLIGCWRLRDFRDTFQNGVRTPARYSAGGYLCPNNN